MQQRYQDAKTILQPSLFDKLQKSRVLMVGAGGIGCELLKNLVMIGFQNIEIVDLDTIDLSNLNRQFLFQKKHISKSKAHVARESALKFNPHVSIKSHHANIMESRFDLEWFKSFDIVLNALDNIAARKYVNRMCLAAGVPLCESGTEGYLGQTTVHVKGKECYDCRPKPTPKTFPVCTIRSTPSQPIHCIVWAKSWLYTLLFGPEEENEDKTAEDAASATEKEDNAAELEALKAETAALKRLRAAAGTPSFADKVFQKVFSDDLKRLASMEDMWRNRKAPTPLDITKLNEKNKTIAAKAGLERDQTVWSLEENFKVFKESLESLGKQIVSIRESDPNATLSFDKDDDTSLDFVTAASNLRALVFKIAPQTRFKVKEMAGNIIPAIATTNAIIAGMVVLEALKILDGRFQDCKRTVLSRVAPKQTRLFQPEALEKSNPLCTVCNSSYFVMICDTQSRTLKSTLDFVRKRFDISHLEEFAITESSRLLYDPDFDDNEGATLSSLGVVDGCTLMISFDDDDEGKRYLLQLTVKHQDRCTDVSLSGADTPLLSVPLTHAVTSEEIMVAKDELWKKKTDDGNEEIVTRGIKRKNGDHGDEIAANDRNFLSISKKRKPNQNDISTIDLDDVGDAAILLD